MAQQFRIPLCRPSLSKEDIDNVVTTLRSGFLVDEATTSQFENEFAGLIGSTYAVALNSATSALQLAVGSLKRQGEVLLPSFTFPATANAVVNAGSRPVFIDVKPETMTLDPDLLEEAITPATIAIIPVHFAGLAAEMDKIVEIAEKYRLALIEDSAEAIGARWSGKIAGSFGTGCFSFFPTKNMTTGEGGMLTTDNPDQAEYVRLHRAHGVAKCLSRERPWIRDVVVPGYNFRMTAFQAALGRSQLSRINRMNEERRRLASVYSKRLGEIEELILPIEEERRYHVYQMYVVRIKDDLFDRDAFLSCVRGEGVEASAHFCPPLHLSSYYRDIHDGRKLAVTEILSSSVVTLPLHPEMGDSEIDQVVEVVKKAIRTLTR